MPFNCLVLTCLTHDTSLTDTGTRVSIKPISNEKLLFFSIDNTTNPKSTIRDDLKIADRICDLIIYRQGLSQKTICLVELKKGNNVSDAIQQVLETREKIFAAFKESVKNKKYKEEYENLIWKAYIRVHGSSPPDIKKYKKKLDQYFKKGNYKISAGEDIGKFLRAK